MATSSNGLILEGKKRSVDCLSVIFEFDDNAKAPPGALPSGRCFREIHSRTSGLGALLLFYGDEPSPLRSKRAPFSVVRVFRGSAFLARLSLLIGGWARKVLKTRHGLKKVCTKPNLKENPPAILGNPLSSPSPDRRPRRAEPDAIHFCDAASACSMSALMSSTSSRPTERRM